VARHDNPVQRDCEPRSTPTPRAVYRPLPSHRYQVQGPPPGYHVQGAPPGYQVQGAPPGLRACPGLATSFTKGHDVLVHDVGDVGAVASVERLGADISVTSCDLHVLV
jgi:hypothetical protein